MPGKYRTAFTAVVLLALSSASAPSDAGPSRLELLASLAGVPSTGGLLIRKMRAPISFAMGPLGGEDPKYASDIAFFKALDSEVAAFLKESLKERYSTDRRAPSIRVIVQFPDSRKGWDEAWLDKIFRFGDAVIRDRKGGDYYLMECRDLVQNLGDPYNEQSPPNEQWSVWMAGSLDVELGVRGTDYDRGAVTRCLYRHILAGLGLRGEIPAGEESIFAKDDPAVRPTEFDRWAVEMLYGSDAEAGQKMDVAFPELPKTAP